jgi:hypothetical protein
MTHAQIVATYSDGALAGIIRQLSISGAWGIRLTAAMIEQNKRKIKEK